jgi:hypothetical protein
VAFPDSVANKLAVPGEEHSSMEPTASCLVADRGPHQQEDYMAQAPTQKPPEPSISDQAFQHMTDEQRRDEQQRREQAKSPSEDGSQNQYPGTGSPS